MELRQSMYFTSTSIRCVDIENCIHFSMTNIHIFGLQFILCISPPRKSIVTATSRKTVVSNSNNLIFTVHNTKSKDRTIYYTMLPLVYSDLFIRFTPLLYLCCALHWDMPTPWNTHPNWCNLCVSIYDHKLIQLLPIQWALLDLKQLVYFDKTHQLIVLLVYFLN